jgi:predicted ATPase
LLSLGELEPARAQLEQALALYDPGQQHSPAFFYGLEPGVLGLAFVAWDLWLLGYPDQALARSQAALALAQTLSQPPASADALFLAAELHLHRREAQSTRELAQALLALASEHGFPFWLAHGTMLSGWVLAEQGRAAEGIERMQQGLSAHQATGAELWRPHFLALLADAYGKAGQAEAGLKTLAEALAVVERTEERVYEAELYRLKGELTLLQPGREGDEAGRRDEAEACFLQAIAIARRQGARSLELRAVMDLSRLLRQQGKAGDARQMLAETYGWFTEGFDTADLQEAKALLAELD